ncbi:acyl-CoA desaturase [Spirulina major]|uniref:acyl-CoA desaturase n=1 Tax=Spirulina major TaxID=270636 RepID=UPI0009334B0E|nr:acyl-CoA desaturase [Spirulina major]
MTLVSPQKMPLNWLNIWYVALIHIGALFAFVPGTFSWNAVGVMLLLHWVTGGLGITLGWHRLVSHRSFKAPKWLEYFFVFCGTLACQGGVIQWVGLHRYHHLYSDKSRDPHDSSRGFFWSHMGWMFYRVEMEPEVPRITKDIKDDPVYQFLHNYFVPIQAVLGLVLYALGGWPFVVWGIFVRLIVVMHCTWFVNSATHMFGYRTFDSDDKSRNCWWVALVTYGEGWHNNHHAYQYSAQHGIKWWELDLTWAIIRMLRFLGLATDVKLIPQEVLDSKE